VDSRVSFLVVTAIIAGAASATQAQQVNVNRDITTSTTWTASNTYNLEGKIKVMDGATLTIEPGVVIASTSANASLVVTRGAKIFALGTQVAPIIVTSDEDVATWAADAGHPTGKNPETGAWREKSAEWGGLKVLGKAYISEDSPGFLNTPAPNAGNKASMPAVPAPFSYYGGGDDDDDSGVVKYVSLRYAGGPIDKIGGALALGGVGRETDIHHVEVMNSYHDGVSLLGGTVNLKYLSVWNAGDDSVDIDQGYRGKIQFALLVQGFSSFSPTYWVQGVSIGDNLFEVDGAEGSTYQPVTTTSIYNVTAIGQPALGAGDHGTAWRDNARAQYRNSIFMDLGAKLVYNGNDDDNQNKGYGWGGTTSWENTWLTSSAVTSPLNPFPVPADAYKAQQPGALAEITDSVFFRNEDANAYTQATARGVLPPNGTNNNVLIAGAADVDAPIQSLVRGAPVVKGSYTMLPLVSLDPRPANAALTAVSAAPADGFFTPAAYRGAFAPGDTWLAQWTASDAFGLTSTPSPWRNLGYELQGVNQMPELLGAGPLTDGSMNSLQLVNSAQSAMSALFVSTRGTPISFKGGKLLPYLYGWQLILPTDGNGGYSLPFIWPSGVPAGLEIFLQQATVDPAAVQGISLSNALRLTAQ